MTIRISRVRCKDAATQAQIDALPKFKNEEAKWLLVEALLSGEYKQAEGRLNNGDGGFCCLGVATDVAIKQGAADGAWAPRGGTMLGMEYKNEAHYLALDVQRWLRCDYRNPEVIYNGCQQTLAALNDELKVPFDMIAGLIINQL